MHGYAVMRYSPRGLMIYERISRHMRVIHSMICQACGLDKKIDKPKLVDFLEASPRFELGDNGVADRGLTTWL